MATMARQVTSSGRNIGKMQFARNDLRVLAAIRDYGVVRSDQLTEILPFRGFKKIILVQTYGFTKRLMNMGFVKLDQMALASRAGVFNVTPEGHARLRACGWGIEVNANPFTSAEPSVEHFLTLNDIMLKFHKQFPVSYWLTDFLVRSENQLRQERGFAKDYDAVGKIMVGEKPFAVAIEYEHTLKNRAAYSELFKSYAHDPYIQLVIFIADSPNWMAPLTESVKVPGTRLCFVTKDQFLTQPFGLVPAVRWNGQTLEGVTLGQAVEQATRNKRTEYSPTCRLPQ